MRTIVFDVNETLLDISALDPHFERIFGDAAIRREWFMQVILSAMTLTALQKYTDFGSVGRHALTMVAARRNIALSEKDVQQISQNMRKLPAHREVPAALERLKSAGFRLVALTNSSADMAQSQLSSAGIIDYFEKVLSVDGVRQFKPVREVYEMAATELHLPPQQLIMVAAHEWDTSGAINAGWSAAFVARPGMVAGPLSAETEFSGRDLLEIADQLIAAEKP